MTAVDYTEAMLEEAKKNAGAFAQKITYCQMDASHLHLRMKHLMQ